jgi:hypothetical protein
MPSGRLIHRLLQILPELLEFSLDLLELRRIAPGIPGLPGKMSRSRSE